MEQLWNPYLGNETYKNPILYADYSDPDVICVDGEYYMVASSFTYLPGVPLLHSKDLVHWNVINYCVRSLPFARYNQPAHGAGTWAPSIRYENHKFYVFVPLPDEGIFVTTSGNPYGKFSKLKCLKEAKGWIDPCPLWDEDGKAYMVFAYAGSRCGKKHRLSICEIDWEAETVLTEPKEIYDGTLENPTVEGPKFYKKNGWYYIFAPAGGVETGWQIVLRSRNIYGPYEWKRVLHQGSTPINGPHQGGYIETQDGRGFFLHFQDKGAYGRILHLQPVTWIEEWPYMGTITEQGMAGEPIEQGKIKGLNGAVDCNNGTDEFRSTELAPMWQWQANPKKEWYSLRQSPGRLRLFVQCNEGREKNLLWYAPNACTQILPAPSFAVNAKVKLCPKADGDMVLMGMLGHQYSYLALIWEKGVYRIKKVKGRVTNPQQKGEAEEEERENHLMEKPEITIRIIVENGTYQFGISMDGVTFQEFGKRERLTRGTWTGAKFVIAALNASNYKSAGYGEFEAIRFTKGDMLC